MKVPSGRIWMAAMMAGALLPLFAVGCNYLGEATSFDPEELDQSSGWVAVRNVPVVLQKERTECGAAALSMVFGYWSIPMSMEQVTHACPLVPETGIKAGDLRDFARGEGLQSYLIHGQWEDLERELQQSHPVIVGLVKTYISGAITHYEVVVAVHPAKKTVITLDPANGWRQNTLDGFRKEWEPAGFLTMVFVRKESKPVSTPEAP